MLIYLVDVEEMYAMSSEYGSLYDFSSELSRAFRFRSAAESYKEKLEKDAKERGLNIFCRIAEIPLS